MSIRTLTTADLHPSHVEDIQAGETGDMAEDVVAEEYNLVDDSEKVDWYDCRHPDTGAKTEVKSTHRTIGGPKTRPRNGRFRLWRGAHRSLASAEGQGTAYYAFVLIDIDAREVHLRRVRVPTVTGWVADRGGWTKSGHHNREEEHKLPWTVVFDGL